MISIPNYVDIDLSNWNMQLVPNHRRYEHDDGSVQTVMRTTCGIMRQNVTFVICGGCDNLKKFKVWWQEIRRGSCSFCFTDPCGDQYAAKIINDLTITGGSFRFGRLEKFRVDVTLEMLENAVDA